MVFLDRITATVFGEVRSQLCERRWRNVRAAKGRDGSEEGRGEREIRKKREARREEGGDRREIRKEKADSREKRGWMSEEREGGRAGRATLPCEGLGGYWVGRVVDKLWFKQGGIFIFFSLLTWAC